MTNLLDLLVFQGVFSWSLIVITLSAMIVLSRLFGLNYLNGLLHAQVMLFFNATTIIAGLDSEAVSIGRGFHFYIIEFSFLALTFSTYRYLLNHRVRVLASMQEFFNGHGALFVTTSVVAIAFFNYILAPTDGSSRIAYMTEAWFSLIKPFIQLVTPLSYLGVFIMFLNPRRRHLGYVLMVVTVIANIATGSKASFAINLFIAFLTLRDLAGPIRFGIRLQELLTLSLFAGLAVIFALTRLDVSGSDILDRFFLSGEATILTYFSDTPTAACANVSTFASMHRGWARLLGDASAQNIDTLFGFALNIEEFGVNTFTGPNARLSAYVLCNFEGARVIFGALVVMTYLLLMLVLFRRLLKHPTYLTFVYPFLLTSLGVAAQDFNLIMQDITIFVILLLFSIFFYIRPVRHKFG
jgi:hypothetical protein